MLNIESQNLLRSPDSDKEHTAYLYFTHGTLLQEFSKENKKDCKQEWAKYCSISALEVGLNHIGEQIEN